MKKSTSLTKLLCQIKDKRRKQGTRHELSEILLTVIISTMSGYYGYRGMEDFCNRYEKELKEVFGNPKHGIASYSCIRRVLMNLDFNVLSHKFNQWIRGKVDVRKREWLQLDGKGMKGTITDYESKQQNFINLVSLFMNRTGIVLMAQPMNNKEQSEINVVRELIKQLKLKGIVLSMDALHCQKKTLNQIVTSKNGNKNGYIVKVKGNQKKLLQEMEQICDSKKCLDSNITKEINRGRKEKRTTKTFKVSQYIKMNWPGALTVVYVERERRTKKGKAISYSYYLSSILVKAKEFAIGIRHHWGIENRLYQSEIIFSLILFI